MKYHIITFLCCCLSLQLNGQFGEPLSKGTQSLSMGGSDVLLTGVDALFTNQSGLTSVEGVEIMASGQQLYGLAEINDFNLAAAFRLQDVGVFGVSINAFGFDAFNEVNVGLGYGRKLAKNLSLGAKLNLFNTTIQNFGKRFLSTFEVGLQSTILPKLQVGVHVFSPITIAVTPDQDIASKFSLGFGYRPTDRLLVSLETSKYIDGALNISAGVDYSIIPLLSLRVGVGTDPGIFSGGIAFHVLDNYTIEGGVSIHEVLGMTPGITVKYNSSRNTTSK